MGAEAHGIEGAVRFAGHRLGGAKEVLAEEERDIYILYVYTRTPKNWLMDTPEQLRGYI